MITDETLQVLKLAEEAVQELISVICSIPGLRPKENLTERLRILIGTVTSTSSNKNGDFITTVTPETCECEFEAHFLDDEEGNPLGHRYGVLFDQTRKIRSDYGTFNINVCLDCMNNCWMEYHKEKEKKC